MAAAIERFSTEWRISGSLNSRDPISSLNWPRAAITPAAITLPDEVSGA